MAPKPFMGINVNQPLLGKVAYYIPPKSINISIFSSDLMDTCARDDLIEEGTYVTYTHQRQPTP
ncbi:hypothetical protein TWF730_006361 [Orbilia blumenaviensis]|uniref:Uncharacterized protein n=1 Tax=Orbilia blumenaviensis TaxID=1796055 RepID=A0AAV9VE02_9PEZI